MTLKPCIACGTPSQQSRCPDHNKDTRTTDRGYDWRWNQLSRRARRLQKFCQRCGNTDDLQADHLPAAWERKARGLPIRLKDIQVVCGTCNRDLGSSRPGSPRATQAGGGQPTTPTPVGKAQEALHTPGGIR